MVTQNGCSKRSECTTINIVGLDSEYKEETFTVYPNPNSGDFFIELDKQMVIKVYSVSGDLVFAKDLTAGKHNIKIPNLQSGFYLIKGENSNGIFIEKITITK